MQEENIHIEQENYIKPAFQDLLKGYVVDLIEITTEIPTVIATKQNTSVEVDQAKHFKKTFHRCYILTKNRLQDDTLMKECDEWLSVSGETNPIKHERDAFLKIGYELANRFITSLDEQGIIDFTGRAPKPFPFQHVLKLMKNKGYVQDDLNMYGWNEYELLEKEEVDDP